MGISREELIRLARSGAAARVQELRKELESIYKTFPELRKGTKAGAATAAAGRTVREPGQRSWSSKDRKAVSSRMKKYWAARRAAKTPRASK